MSIAFFLLHNCTGLMLPTNNTLESVFLDVGVRQQSSD